MKAIAPISAESSEASKRIRVGVIMNGVTGGMGTNQHLVRSILAIREQGGVRLGDGGVIWPDPILVGRREGTVRELAAEHGIAQWSTDLAACLRNADATVYFAPLTTHLPPPPGPTSRAPAQTRYAPTYLGSALD